MNQLVLGFYLLGIHIFLYGLWDICYTSKWLKKTKRKIIFQSMWTLCEIQILVSIQFCWTTAMFINLCIIYSFFHITMAELKYCHKIQRTKMCIVSTSAKNHTGNFVYGTISNPNKSSVRYYVHSFMVEETDAERLVTCSCHIGGKQWTWHLISAAWLDFFLLHHLPIV